MVRAEAAGALGAQPLFRYLYLVHQRHEVGSPEEVLLRDWPLIIDIRLWLATSAIVLVAYRY